MNLTPTNTNGASGDLLVRFNGGHHSSLREATNTSGNPAVSSSAEVFAEIQAQIPAYFASGNGTLTITDPNVIAAP